MEEMVRNEKWHLLSKNETIIFPTLLFFVDTETNAKEISKDEISHTLRFGEAIKWERDEDVRGNRLNWLEFTNAKDFWNWVNKSIRKKRKGYVFAHNWSFDFRILKGDKYLTELGWNLRIPIRDTTRWMDKWREEERLLHVIDTLNIFKESVRSLGKSVGLEKIEVDFEKCSEEELKEHCKRDVEIIYFAVKKLLRWLREEKLSSFKPTLPAISFAAFRHKFMKHDILIHKHKEATELELNSYRGGWNECFFIGCLNRVKVYYMDVQSMYPSVMKDNEFPTIFEHYTNKLKVKELEKLMENYLVIAQVNIEVDKRCVGIKRERLIFPRGKFKAVLTSPELKYVMENGKVHEVKEAVWYKGEKIFQSFISYMWNKRKKAKEERNEIDAKFYKLLMNSLYGKFGQRGYDTEKIDYDDGVNDAYYSQYYDIEEDKLYNCYRHGKDMWRSIKEGVAENGFPAIASFVTAYARIKLVKLIEKAGRENVFYIDTDSLFTNEEGYRNLKEEIKKGELGKLELKGIDKAEFWGAKDYKFGEKRKIKGIKDNAKLIGDNEYEQWQFEGYKTSLRHGREGEVILKRVKKKLSKDYKKGELTKTGKVEPFTFLEF